MVASALSDVRRRRAKFSECRKGPPLSPTSLSTGFALALSSEMRLKSADLARRVIEIHAVVGWTRCGVSASQRATIDIKEGMKPGSLLSHVKYAKPIGEN